MYEELVKRLREYAKEHCPLDSVSGICGCIVSREAADAIEERDKYALTIQHEMMAEAESHIALVERLNKQIEELQKQVACWQAQLTKSMCGETLAELEKPRWIPVTEQCPEKSGDYLVFDDCRNLYVNEWHCLLKKWQYDDSRITHWQPIPEPPKEESDG